MRLKKRAELITAQMSSLHLFQYIPLNPSRRCFGKQNVLSKLSFSLCFLHSHTQQNGWKHLKSMRGWGFHVGMVQPLLYSWTPMLASGSEENMEPQQQMLFKRNIPIQSFRFQVPCWSSGCYWQTVFKSFFIQLRTYPSCTGLIIPLYQPKQRTIIKGKPCLFPIYWIYHLVNSHSNQTPHVPRGNASTNAWCWNFYVGLVESTDRFPSWQLDLGLWQDLSTAHEKKS